MLRNPWAVLALLFFARTSMAVHFQSIPPIAPRLIAAWGIGYTEIGILIGLSMFAGIALALPGGLLSRRVGDRAVVLLGLGALTAGSAGFALAPGYPAAFAARLVGGVGVVLLNVQLTRIVMDWFARSRLATAMAILMTAWPAGIALVLSVLGYLADAVGWRLAVGATAAYSGVMLLFVALMYPRTPAVPAAAAQEGEPPRLWVISRSELALIALAALVWMLPNAAFIVFLSFTPGLLAAGGMPTATAALVTGLASWITIASVPLGGALADRTGRMGLHTVLGLGACASVMLALALGDSPWLWAVLLGVAVGGWPGPIMTLPGQALTPQGRATGFGVFYTVYYLGMATLVPLAGWLRDATGDPAAPLNYSVALVLAPVVPLLAFRVLHRRLSPLAANPADPRPAPDAASGPR